MNSHHPIPPMRLRFAQYLRGIVQAEGLSDPAMLGAALAKAQLSPQRSDILYHPAAIAAWRDGRALPEPLVFGALCSLLSPNNKKLLSRSYEAAKAEDPTAMIPEHILALDDVLHHPPVELMLPTISSERFGEWMHTIGGYGPGPVSKATIFTWRKGIHVMPSAALAAADMVLARLGSDLSLSTFDALRPRLPELSPTTSLPSTLRAMRSACDLPLAAMAERISTITGRQLHRSILDCWEQESGVRRAVRLNPNYFPDTTPLEVYGQILSEHGQSSWFERNRATLRTIMEPPVPSMAGAQTPTVEDSALTHATMVRATASLLPYSRTPLR